MAVTPKAGATSQEAAPALQGGRGPGEGCAPGKGSRAGWCLQSPGWKVRTRPAPPTSAPAPPLWLQPRPCGSSPPRVCRDSKVQNTGTLSCAASGWGLGALTPLPLSGPSACRSPGQTAETGGHVHREHRPSPRTPGLDLGGLRNEPGVLEGGSRVTWWLQHQRDPPSAHCPWGLEQQVPPIPSPVTAPSWFSAHCLSLLCPQEGAQELSRVLSHKDTNPSTSDPHRTSFNLVTPSALHHLGTGLPCEGRRFSPQHAP